VWCVAVRLSNPWKILSATPQLFRTSQRRQSAVSEGVFREWKHSACIVSDAWPSSLLPLPKFDAHGLLKNKWTLQTDGSISLKHLSLLSIKLPLPGPRDTHAEPRARWLSTNPQGILAPRSVEDPKRKAFEGYSLAGQVGVGVLLGSSLASYFFVVLCGVDD